MAISLEELALGALEGSAGPWTLAVGAGALAVALAAGSARPLRRMASTGAFVAQRRGSLNLTGWLGGARQGWRDLVAEARSEYEAGRRPAAQPAPVALATPQVGEPTVSPAAVTGPRTAEVVDTVAAPSPVHETPVHETPAAKRDQRGRFVRRPASANGTRSE